MFCWRLQTKISYSLDMGVGGRSLFEIKPKGATGHFQYLPEFNSLVLRPVSTQEWVIEFP